MASPPVSDAAASVPTSRSSSILGGGSGAEQKEGKAGCIAASSSGGGKGSFANTLDADNDGRRTGLDGQPCCLKAERNVLKAEMAELQKNVVAERNLFRDEKDKTSALQWKELLKTHQARSATR